MSESTLSATFGGWRDRLTYVVAEAQLLVAGLLVALGVFLWWFNPSLPGVPPWFTNVLVGWLVLGPPMFVAGLRFVDWLRIRNYVEVNHVNAVEDILQTYFVPPDLWDEKMVVGPAPYRVNDGEAVAVREFDWRPEDGEDGRLVVAGVYLSELEDAKLYTSQKHAERMYEELVDAYLSLAYVRESVSDLAASLQTRLINEVIYAREAGEQLDKAAITQVTDEFEEQAETVSEAEVTDLGDEDVPDAMNVDGNPETDAEIGTEPAGGEAADDGGGQSE